MKNICPEVHVFYQRKSRRKQDFIKQVSCQEDYEKRFNIKCHLISDTASGNDPDREGFAELMALARTGMVKAVSCYHPDRITRDIIESASFWRVCSAKGIEIRSYHRGFEPYDPRRDELLFMMESCFAQEERKRIAQRTKDVLAEKRKQKIIHGGSPGGWRAEKTIEQAPIILQLFDAGQKKRRIAKVLHIDIKKVRNIIKTRNEPLLTRKQRVAQVPLHQRGKRYREMLENMKLLEKNQENNC